MDQSLPVFSPAQMMQMMQMFQTNQSHGQHLVPQGNLHGAPMQPNHPIPAHPFNPGIIGLQMQMPPPVGTSPAMLQMQVQRQQLAQNHFGLVQNSGSGTQFPFASPNVGVFLPGVPSQQAVRGVGAPLFLNSEDSTAGGREFSDDDEDRFARTLLAQRENVNFGDILDSLNGVNGHSKSQWLDYYMRNSTKIAQLMKQFAGLPSKARKSPLPSGASSRKQPSKRTPQKSRENIKHGRLHNHRTFSSSKKSQSFPRSRSLRSRQARRRIPHSPTPPAVVVKNKSMTGNKYTSQDLAYLKKFLMHALKHNAGVLKNRNKFCEELGKRAPHHTAASWVWCMRRHEDIVEQARREVLGDDSSSESEFVNEKYDEDMDAPKYEEVRSESSEDSSSGDEMDVSLRLSSSESEGGMRSKENAKSRYPPSERRALAHYIANITLEKWDNREVTWVDFQRKYNKHSIHAWKQWFRKNKEEVLRMARRFEIRNGKRKEAARLESLEIKIETPSLEQHTSSSIGSHPPESPSAGPSTPKKRVRIQDVSDESYQIQPVNPSRTSTETPQDIIHVGTSSSIIGEANKESVSNSEPN